MDWLWGLDGDILMFLQNYVRMPVLNELMKVITSLGDAGFIAILTCVVLLVMKKYRTVGLTAAVSLLIEFVIVNVLLKNMVARIRPYEVIEGLNCITKLASDFSFPSGHTGSCFAVAVVMLMSMPKKYGVSAMIAASLMGFSRLYVGVHYPTDVLAGAAIGAATAVLSCLIFHKLLRQRKRLDFE